MKPIGPLMREHRLIERMVNILNLKLIEMQKSHKVDIDFVHIAIDFFRVYADRTHHGKEEDILFKELAQKPLAVKDKETMNQLIQEHI